MEAKRQFSLFHSPIALAHFFWKKQAEKGGWALDATCGNGHDTQVLCALFEGVIGLDIQEAALASTRQRVGDCSHLHLYHMSHVTFPAAANDVPISLIVYNLGYLPGSDKTVTTEVNSTLKSLEEALSLLVPGGLISITCYPGHMEGEREEEALLSFCATLPKNLWCVTTHTWANRTKAPSLIFLQKNL